MFLVLFMCAYYYTSWISWRFIVLPVHSLIAFNVRHFQSFLFLDLFRFLLLQQRRCVEIGAKWDLCQFMVDVTCSAWRQWNGWLKIVPKLTSIELNSSHKHTHIHTHTTQNELRRIADWLAIDSDFTSDKFFFRELSNGLLDRNERQSEMCLNLSEKSARINHSVRNCPGKCQRPKCCYRHLAINFLRQFYNSNSLLTSIHTPNIQTICDEMSLFYFIRNLMRHCHGSIKCLHKYVIASEHISEMCIDLLRWICVRS